MNRLEANISLFAITFFSSLQFVFVIWIPDTVSHFAFLCVTNLLGFLISLAFFFGELFRLDMNQVKQCVILSAELIVFNLFMLMGVGLIGASITNAILSANFIFIAVISYFRYHQIPSAGTISGSVIVLAGLLLMSEAGSSGFLNMGLIYVTISSFAFAFYVVSVGEYSASSNPSIIAMGQMFFCFVFSLVLWAGEVILSGASFALPTNHEFWGAVIYISFFIRGLYGIIQVYAQRYVTPMNTSLIFSTEIVMTVILSPVLAGFLSTPPEVITWRKAAGCAAIVLGFLMTEPQFFAALRRLAGREKH